MTMCDVMVRGERCHEEPVRYNIQVGPDHYQVDLCNQHAKHILHAIEIGTPVEPPRTNRESRKGRSRIRVVN